MKTLIAVLLGGFFMFVSHQANAQAVCGKRESLLRHLGEKYKEEPISMALAANGSVVEVTRSEKGTWSILLTHPNGLTCLMAAGSHWEAVSTVRKGDGT